MVEEKVLQLMRMKGPILPTNIAKDIGQNLLMTGAILSQLSSAKKIKVTHMKIGGSPLYYLPEDAEKLQNFSHKLPPALKKAYDLLRERKVLREKMFEAFVRVALREISDFAVPLQVGFQGQKEVFWKWYMLGKEETEQHIRQLLTPELGETEKKEEKPVEEVKKEVRKEIEKVKEVEETVKDEKIAEPQKPLETKREVVKEKKPSEEAPKAPKEEVVQASVKEEIATEQTQLVKKEGALPETPFLEKVMQYFEENHIEVLKQEQIKKGSDYEFRILVPSQVGKLSFYCRAKKKKKVNDGDLSSAYVQGQAEHLLVLFLTPGEIVKKVQETMHTQFKGLVFKQLP